MSKNETHSLEKTKLLIRCYIEIVKNDFRTNIPRFIRCFLVKEVIYYSHLNFKFIEQINEEITSVMLSMDKKVLFEKDSVMVARRKACITELDSLNSCYKLVQQITERLKN